MSKAKRSSHLPGTEAQTSCAWLFAILVCAGCVGTSASPAGPGEPGSDHGTSVDPNKPSDAPSAPDDNPGRVTLHRLNRVEYNNTVRDLLGTSLRPADKFPADDRGYGYDNIADVLSLSPLQLELYYSAAQELVQEALRDTLRRLVLEAEAGVASVGEARDGGWALTAPGRVTQTTRIEAPGEYRLRVRAWEERAGDEPARMVVELNGSVLSTVDVPGTRSAPTTFETTVTLAAGEARVAAAFENDLYDPNAGLDRNLVVDAFELEGPLGAEDGARRRVVSCEPDPGDPVPCLRTIAKTFGKRAFRRPLHDTEVERLVQIAITALDAGDDVRTALPLMLEAILISPHFLFRVELEPEPGAGSVLNDYELASRLSYFLWSSMPDDELFALADAGELTKDDVLKAQVKRMLRDPRAEALVQNFAGQWLFSRAMHDHAPDRATFPSFDDALREAAAAETEAYFRVFLQGEESMDRFLSADFSFVNARLAEHYGMTPPVGDELVRMTLPSNRFGLLTQTTLLTVTSYPTRTSPVKRGKWLLEQILCTPPPPPPANIPPLEESETEATTVREQLEQHRKDPVCASCHKIMDPLGFGLERFDAIGAARESEGGHPIDDSGELPDGTTFQGARELAQLIELDERYPRCITEHLLTYALGRGLEQHDRKDVEDLTMRFVSGGYLLPQLIEDIVLSAPFRMRGKEPEERAP